MQGVHMATNWKRKSPDGRHSSTAMSRLGKKARADSEEHSATKGVVPASDERSISPVLSRILGVDELAAFFNCSTAKINRRSRSGELPAFKFGKSWFVRERDLEIYIQRKLKSPMQVEQD
jgi:hypothetical protein